MSSDTLDICGASAGKITFAKDPAAVLDYTFDWTAYLADLGDTIQSAVHAHGRRGGTISIAPISDGNVVKVWVSGGNVYLESRLACKITTAGNRVDERSIYLQMLPR